jgi:hypothetical protein
MIHTRFPRCYDMRQSFIVTMLNLFDIQHEGLCGIRHMAKFEDNLFMHHLIHEEEDVALIFGILDIRGVKVRKIGKSEEEGLHSRLLGWCGQGILQDPPRLRCNLFSIPMNEMMVIKEDTL